MSDEITYREILGASDYLMGSDDYVFSLKSKKKLTKEWQGKHYITRVIGDDGRVRYVNHNYCNVVVNDSIPEDELEEVEGYPDYKVTPHGAVWKYRNLTSNRRNSPFILKVVHKFGKDYVRLKTEDGRAHWVRVEKIVADAYPNY